MQESGSDVECSEESSSSEEEEDVEFSANEEDGKINPTPPLKTEEPTFKKKTKNQTVLNECYVLFKLRMRRTP